MGRLVVDVADGEISGSSLWAQNTLPAIAVSVSRADDGAPVTRLKDANFRVTLFLSGMFRDVTCWVTDEDEGRFEPDDILRSGMYQLRLEWKSGQALAATTWYFVGVQVRVFGEPLGPHMPTPVLDRGQGVCRIITPKYGP